MSVWILSKVLLCGSLANDLATVKNNTDVLWLMGKDEVLFHGVVYTKQKIQIRMKNALQS
jgi:hypothetical protein